MTVAEMEADRIEVASVEHEPVHELIGRQPPGHALLQPFYTSPDIYRHDVERFLMRHWICVGHESSIPSPGDYFLFELDRESVIIVRGQDNIVRALVNVCRHRGSRICSQPSGHARSGLLVCPYHAWVYTTEGRLRNARLMPKEFDVAAHGLNQIPLRVIEGLIFVTFADPPLGLSQVEETIRSSLGAYGWGAAKVIHQATYPVSANWKLAVENQMECYHCGPAHPDYTRLHSQARPGVCELSAAMEARTESLGIRIPARDQWALKGRPHEEADYCARYAMWGDAVTASEDGKPVAPLMGRFTAHDGGTTFVYAGPVSFFLAYSDYGAIFRYTPRSVSESELHVTWLVSGDAQEGVDYDVERVTWLWRVTAAADKQIIEQNHLGVASRYYRPGPYAVPIEDSSRRFAEWVLHEIAHS